MCFFLFSLLSVLWEVCYFNWFLLKNKLLFNALLFSYLFSLFLNFADFCSLLLTFFYLIWVYLFIFRFLMWEPRWLIGDLSLSLMWAFSAICFFLTWLELHPTYSLYYLFFHSVPCILKIISFRSFSFIYELQNFVV